MPIISTIGRKQPRVRALIVVIYVLLVGGSLTMLYPFFLMVAGSTKSAVDAPQQTLVPAFLVDAAALYRKAVESLFNESLGLMVSTYDRRETSFQDVQPPRAVRDRFVAEWREFTSRANLPHEHYACGYIQAPVTRGALPFLLRRFKRQMEERFDGDLDRMNDALGTELANWSAFLVVAENYISRRSVPGQTPFDLAFREFKTSQPTEYRIYFSPEGHFKNGFLRTQYSDNIDAYNRAHETGHTSWREIRLARRLPSGPGATEKHREEWTVYVRGILNLLWMRADPEAAPAYRDFLEAKYSTVEALNRNYGTGYASFDAVPLIGKPPAQGLGLSDWDAFVQGWTDPGTGKTHILPSHQISIYSTEFLFRDYLRGKYGAVEALNTALGTAFDDWMAILPPQRGLHYRAMMRNARTLRREFALRNFATVFDYIVLRGRAVFNTTVYCLLQILCALTINPLAAYALSRYKPPTAYKVLLFLMLTMAFPPMVTQIPNFLMLRELGLLNTFWALVLPGMANGYSVFLLKGFFDSLPQELYESAQLDGAGEFRIFFTITMSLSRPILAVIALRAFTIAYSNFMMALLICQDQRMWTLMPWLYQLQQRSGQGVVFASLLIAAVPTFIVFVTCQKVIMRGIVVPVEK